MTTRRELIKASIATTALAALPATVLAAQRRVVDLAVMATEWSHDGGLTWHASGQMPERAELLFRARVKNVGQAAARINTPLVVDFSIAGEVVATSNSHRRGLAPGSEVVLEANDGPMGDPYWYDPGHGSQALTVSVDPENLFHQDAVSRTDVIIEVTVSDIMAAIGEVAGLVTGGVPGMIGGHYTGQFLGAIIDRYTGELAPTSFIGYRSDLGSAGGYFPKRADLVALDWGVSSAEVIEQAVKRYGVAPTLSRRYWRDENPDIWGNAGAIRDLGNNRNAANAYVWMHRAQFLSEGNEQDGRDLNLFGDGFFDSNGNRTPNGGRATDEGCGTVAFYKAACLATTISQTNYVQVGQLIEYTGCASFRFPGWRNGVVPMHYQSLIGLALSDRPSPTNGSRRYSRNGLLTCFAGGRRCADLVRDQSSYRHWIKLFALWAKNSSFHGAQMGQFFAKLIELALRYGMSNKSRIFQELRRDLEQNHGWIIQQLDDLAMHIDNFFAGEGMTREGLQFMAHTMLSEMRTGSEENPAIVVVNAAYLRTRASEPLDRLIDNYGTVHIIYDMWLEGALRPPRRIDVDFNLIVIRG